MPIQVKRLLMVFGLFIAIMAVLIYFLTPESWGEFGHYRGLALKEIADKEVKHVDVNETCAMCHDSISATFASGEHKSINCQNCHNVGYKHVEDPTKENIVKPEVTRDFCLRCHAKNPARPENYIKQVDAIEHNKDKVCINCHNPHKPWE
ncbi:MAG: hypothetical protein A2046_17075 [Bacteroidetes bacterium GWA2_30_7]|nr:MAG: hypothetical protein A2046_17075 [Bacteroidetes bacterium GWA2_30_7]